MTQKILSDLTVKGTLTAAGLSISSGSITLPANSVTYGDIQQVAADRLLGNATGSPANVAEISLGSSLVFSGSSVARAALTGDVTATQDSNSTTIAANAITNSKFRQSAANSVVANATGSTANVADLTASADNQFLWRTGGALGFTQPAASNLSNGVTGSGNIVLATTPTIAGMTVSANTAITFSGSAPQMVVTNGKNPALSIVDNLAVNYLTIDARDNFGVILLRTFSNLYQHNGGDMKIRPQNSSGTAFQIENQGTGFDYSILSTIANFSNWRWQARYHDFDTNTNDDPSNTVVRFGTRATTDVFMLFPQNHYLYLQDSSQGFSFLRLHSGASQAASDITVAAKTSFTQQFYATMPSTLTPTGTTQTIDWNAGNVQKLDTTNASGTVVLTLSNGNSGASYHLLIIEGGTLHAVTWPGNVKWPGGVAPTLGISTTNQIDLLYDGTNYYAQAALAFS